LDKKQDFSPRATQQNLRNLILGMRAAMREGECNGIRTTNNGYWGNSIVSTLLAYDLQAGSYISERVPIQMRIRSGARS